MHIISYKLPYKDLDATMEKLQINDIYNVFYENPLEITTDDYGYGYIEKDDEDIILKVALEDGEAELSDFLATLKGILGMDYIDIEENHYDYTSFEFPAIHIDDNWVIAAPEEEFPDKKKINFISQGAFGTGLHETTQDCLRYILKSDLKNKSVLDIGTGSGILSLAAAKKDASKIVALDIRDVSAEIEYNASLNSIDNIEVAVGNALDGEVSFEEKFDFVIINIGGEETLMFKDFIYNTLKDNGTLLISGLVTWSYEDVLKGLPDLNLTIIDKSISNEWVTVLCRRNPL